VAKTQPHRKFMMGLALGKDGIDLWRFSKSNQHKHTGVFPLNWNRGDIGWQASSSLASKLT
jgi:alkyl hydroperoxide reductase subunit AhpC